MNIFLWKQNFKYEDLRIIVMMLFKRGDYLFSFDLKSGYHHVDIAKHHWKYLEFNWEGINYVFTILPFGLSTTCYMFTKVIRPLVRYWRARGLRILVYLDDGLGAMSGEQPAIEASQLVQHTLDECGFVTHPTKSIWRPSQRLIWLGFVVDVGLSQIEIRIEKIENLRSAIQQVSHATHIRSRKLI